MNRWIEKCKDYVILDSVSNFYYSLYYQSRRYKVGVSDTWLLRSPVIILFKTILTVSYFSTLYLREPLSGSSFSYVLVLLPFGVLNVHELWGLLSPLPSPYATLVFDLITNFTLQCGGSKRENCKRRLMTS